jgi:hypothetical protein
VRRDGGVAGFSRGRSGHKSSIKASPKILQQVNNHAFSSMEITHLCHLMLRM